MSVISKCFALLLCGISLTAVFSACSNCEDTVVNYLESNENSMKLAAYVDNYDDLTTIIAQGLTLSETNNLLGFEIVKTEPYGYRTLVNSNRGYVLIYFDTKQVCTGSKLICFSNQEYRINMDNLEYGMSVTDVRKLDPDGEYTFLLSGWSQYPKISYHFFEDGSAFEIHYSDTLEVVEIYAFVI